MVQLLLPTFCKFSLPWSCALPTPTPLPHSTFKMPSHTSKLSSVHAGLFPYCNGYYWLEPVLSTLTNVWLCLSLTVIWCCDLDLDWKHHQALRHDGWTFQWAQRPWSPLQPTCSFGNLGWVWLLLKFCRQTSVEARWGQIWILTILSILSER